MNFRASPLTLLLVVILLGVGAWRLWQVTHPKVIHRPAPAAVGAPSKT